MVFKKLKNRTKVILIAQSVGMLMGTSTHLLWVFKNGFLSDNYNAPIFSKIFWDSLIILDPIAFILLFFKPKLGLYLTAIIISFDIIHNNIFYIEELYLNPPELGIWIKKYWMILGQIIFGGFVVLTYTENLKEIKSKTN